MKAKYKWQILMYFLCHNIYGQLPLEYGQSVVTCGTGDIFITPSIPNATEPVMGIRDVRNNPPFSPNNWPAPEYHNADWVYGTVDATGKKTDKLGTIFGLCQDKYGNIYVTAFSGYNSIMNPGCNNNYNGLGPKGLMPYGFGGPGAVYKIDGLTGGVTLFATLPQQDNLPMFKAGDNTCKTFTDNYGRSFLISWVDLNITTGPGLGNITYDKDHNQFFVTNFEDGKIYRLSSSGTILNSFDPMNPDDGLAGFAPIGERLWGIGYSNNKVYYSVWSQERGTANKNSIRSVGLLSSGNFNITSDNLEFEVEHQSGYTGQNGGDGTAWVMDPISDIEFSSNGNILIVEKSMVTDISERGHTGRGMEYSKATGSWALNHTYFVGGYFNQTNSAGGIDYAYKDWNATTNSVYLNSREQVVWVTGDAIRLPSDCINDGVTFIYGMQSILQTGNTNGCPDVFDNSNVVDFDGNLTQNSKGYIGDVDVFREFCYDTLYTICTNGNETIQLTADVGLTNVVWYDSTSNTQIGTGSILNIVGTESFLSDGYEAIYYTAKDGNGCDWELCCLVRIRAFNSTCTVSVNSQPSCANLTGGDITVVPSPAGTYTYVWSDNGAATANRTGLTGGTYTVTVTNTTTNCTGVCQTTLDTPMNCCNINAITVQSTECLDNGTPNLMTDNRLRVGILATNSNSSLTTYTVSVIGTTITPSSGSYGVGTFFTLGSGTGGSGATYTITLTDSMTPGCTASVQVVSPENCQPATQCPTPRCGTANIQVNGN